jgi:hypothetical protein
MNSISNETKAMALNADILSRYTSIPVLLDMLLNKRLFFSNPKNWADKTDVAFLEKYANGKEIKALCFFKKPESSHYWELYAKCGCMIAFEAKKLLNKIPKKDGFIYDDMNYVEQNEFNLEEYKNKLPFTKQLRYKGEDEYRIIWIGEKNKDISIPIDLNSIERISISGDIKEEIANSLIVIIRKIIGETLTKKITVIHSKLYENKIWLNKINPQQTGKHGRK